MRVPLVAQVDLDAPAGEPLDNGEDAGVAVVRLLVVPQELFPPDVESSLDRLVVLPVNPRTT